MNIPANSRSWVPGADASWFPIQNLPWGKAINDDGDTIDVIRIGDFALDLGKALSAGFFPDEVELTDPILLTMIHGPQGINLIRTAVYEHLQTDTRLSEARREELESFLSPVDELDLIVPCDIPAYVDFYSGIYHASNVGRMFRPDQPPLLPNYRHIPIGYNGRASTVVISGTEIVRPNGQTKGANDDLPTFGPTKELDFELELGVFTHGHTWMGMPHALNDIDDIMFGLVLVNDWSARDFQRWEYQPLGPFLAKSFATSISPWIVPFEALEPFRVNGMPQDPAPLPYLSESEPRSYNIELEVLLQTASSSKPQTICRSNAQHLYWSFRQQLAHQSSNGTVIEGGDLYASGTISGPDEGSFGSMLELSWRGSKPLTIAETGETRTFLEDGDTVIMRAWCEGDGFTLGLGEVSGTIIDEALE